MGPDEVILKYTWESKGPGRPQLLLEIIGAGPAARQRHLAQRRSEEHRQEMCGERAWQEEEGPCVEAAVGRGAGRWTRRVYRHGEGD